jgi:predicted phosphodiesterase
VQRKLGKMHRNGSLVLLASALVLLTAAAAWAATTPAPLELVKGPYLQSAATESIVIMWETSEPSDSRVDYGLTSEYGDSVRDPTPTELHEVVLTGLQRDTRYHYRVTSVRQEATVSSEDGTFQTAVTPGTAFRFVVYGDTRTYPQDHAAVVGGIVASNPRFVIHTGDFVARGEEYWRWQTEYFNPTASLMKNTTVFPCLGNHEHNAEWYYHFFRTPPGGGDHDEQWYSFDYGTCHFVILDSDVDFSAGSDQYAWLEKDLKASTAEWLFVVHHHPAYSSGPHGGHDKVQQHLVPLYEVYGVDIVFSGHDHIYERSRKGGVYYVVSGGGGAPVYDCGQKPNPYRQYCEKTHHFCTIDIDQKRATMRACHSNGAVFDSVALRH